MAKRASKAAGKQPNPGAFKPGDSRINRTGRNKGSGEIEALYRRFNLVPVPDGSGETYEEHCARCKFIARAQLAEVMASGTFTPSHVDAFVKLDDSINNRLYGKPAQSVELSTPDGPLSITYSGFTPPKPNEFMTTDKAGE